MSTARFLSGEPVFFSGELVKDSNTLRRRKLRYFRLVDGALYNYRRKGDPPSKAYSVIDGCIQQLRDNSIVVRMTDGAELHLYTRSPHDGLAWADALRRASLRKIGRFYGIHGIIGSGSFAEVRLGFAKSTGKQVAIKIMRKNKKDKELMTAVNCELNFISRNIFHENIVSTYDVVNTRDTLFIVMEHMGGGMLYDLLATERFFSEKKASYVMRPLLEALKFLHENDIVHRDVKPENVLCTSREWPLRIKLADFGLADVILENHFGDKAVHGMYGTPFFVAPEVVRGDAYGPAVDLWSCGVLLYNMLSGQLPFEGASLTEVLRKVRLGKVSFPAEQWHSVSAEAQSFVRGLLELNPQRRLTAKAALADAWFELAETRPERPTGNDVTVLASDACRERRSSLILGGDAAQDSSTQLDSYSRVAAELVPTSSDVPVRTQHNDGDEDDNDDEEDDDEGDGEEREEVGAVHRPPAAFAQNRLALAGRPVVERAVSYNARSQTIQAHGMVREVSKPFGGIIRALRAKSVIHDTLGGGGARGGN